MPIVTRPREGAMHFTIESMREHDWDAVRAIYREGITTGNATFETDAPEWAAWDRGHLRAGRLVARADGAVIGWAALSPVSARRCYEGVAEASLYVAEAWRGQGVGKALLLRLIAESEAAGIWTLQGGTFPENTASLALQKACGFREVGRRERIGRRDGVWRDTVLTERRSKVVGN